MLDLDQRKAVFEACFRTQAGQKVLDILRDDFINQPMFDKDTHVMAEKAAQHDLVQYICEMARGKPNE